MRVIDSGQSTGSRSLIEELEYTRCPYYQASSELQRRLAMHSSKHDKNLIAIEDKICREYPQRYREVTLALRIEGEDGEIKQCRGRVDLLCIDTPNRRVKIIEFKNTTPAFINLRDIYQLNFYCMIASTILKNYEGKLVSSETTYINGSNLQLTYVIEEPELEEQVKKAFSGKPTAFSIGCELYYGRSTVEAPALSIQPNDIDPRFLNPVELCIRKWKKYGEARLVDKYLIGNECWYCDRRGSSCPIFRG